MPQSAKQDPPAREIASARKTISEQDKQIANTALSYFKLKNFEASLQQLGKLLELRPHDARVSANKAVVEFYTSNLCKTDEFTKLLNTAKKQLEFGMVNTGDELDDIDRSFLLYNQAVVHFHTKRYKAAINILERLFKIIEPLGDMLALKVCVLLVEVYLLSHQLEQAHGMITYIENVMFAPKLQNNENDDSTKTLLSVFKPKVHMFKVRLYMMRGFYGQCKRELKLAMNSSNNSTEALFLKSNVECLRLNFQKSIKLLNSAPKTSELMSAGHPLHVFYYNNMAAVHFAMKKYNLASMYGLKAVEENHRLMKTLPPIEKFNHLSGRSLPTLAVNKRTELHYNLAVSLLHAGQPSKAFDCLIESRTAFQCNPRYWLRLAECCIAAEKQTCKKIEELKNKKSEYVRGVVGGGAHRKIVLSPRDHNSKSVKQEGQSSAMPSPTLEFASICLCNAMLLLPSEETLESNMSTYLLHEKVIMGEDEKELIKRSPAGRLNIEAPPGPPIQTKEAYSLRASILCCQAYVSLCLADYYRSLEYAIALQRMSHLTGPKRFLSLLYQTEALLKLDRVTEASQQLSPEKIKALTTYTEDVADLSTVKHFPKNVNDVRNVTMLNLASVYSMVGEFDKAKQLLKQATASDISMRYKAEAVLLSVYCDLKMGKISSALSLIKRNEVFPSGRLVDRVEARTLMNPPGIGPINPLPPMRSGVSTFQMGNSLFPNGGIPHPPPGNLTQNRPPGSGPPGSGVFSSAGLSLSSTSQLNASTNQTFVPSSGSANQAFIPSSGSTFQRLSVS